MCKKQTSVSHSSTESEIISLDTGLRLDGLPALELWDLIVSVFGNISHVSDRTVQPVNGKNKSYNKIDVMKDSGDGEHDRSGQPDENSWDSLQKVDPHREEYLLGRTAHSARYEETIHDRTGQPVSENLQGKAHFENFIMESEITEFVNKVRDQVRIRQKRMSSIAVSCTEHSIIWGMFMATTLNATTFMGKNFSTIQSVVKNHESLTLKQMFDVTAQIVNNEEEISCLDKILYGKNSWTELSLINDPVIINLQSTKVYVFPDSVLCLGKVLQQLQEYEPRKATEIMMLSVESRQNSGGTFSQDSQRCSSMIKSAIF